MKKVRIITSSIVVIVSFLILLCVGLKSWIVPSMDRNAMRKNLKFPNNIQNVYYVATLEIDDPVVVKLNDRYYILPRTTLQEYKGNDSLFLSRNDVILFYSMPYIHEKYYEKQPYNLNNITNPKAYFNACDTIQNMPVFQFYYHPKDFLLAVCRRYRWVCTQEPDVWDVEHFKDYELVLHPRFTNAQIRKMRRAKESNTPPWLEEILQSINQ